MSKRAKTAKRKNTPALVKASKSASLPAIAKAAKAVPPMAILLAVGACAAAAAAVFLFSGAAGQRRREAIRVAAQRASHDMSEMISKGSRDVRQRLESVATGATKRLRGESSEAMANGRSDQRMGEHPAHV